jgi:hypothetical protein
MIYVYMSHINTILGVIMKTKFKVVLLILILLILLSSNFQAKDALKTKYEEKTGCIGMIQGSVGNSHGVYSWTPYPFSKLTAGTKSTRCNINGDYSMSLFLYHKYNVTAHVKGFKPLTKYVYLTAEDPIRKLTFDMDESEPENIKSIKDSKAVFYGLIFGRTGGVFEHASWPVGFAKLEFEDRSKISGFFGFYVIGFLEIDKTYEITASKEGYTDKTKIVKLTEKMPIQLINFYMHQSC